MVSLGSVSCDSRLRLDHAGGSVDVRKETEVPLGVSDSTSRFVSPAGSATALTSLHLVAATPGRLEVLSTSDA